MNGPLSVDLRQGLEGAGVPDAEALLQSAVRPLAQSPAFLTEAHLASLLEELRAATEPRP